MATCNVQTLLKNAACFGCLSPGEWDVLELQLLCEILNAGGSSGGTIKTFTSSLQAVSAGTSQSAAHGFGVVPKMFSVVAVCATAEQGYGVGDEIHLADCATSQEGNQSLPGYALSADATNIQVQVETGGFASVAAVLNVGAAIPPKGGGGGVALTPANWRIRFDGLSY